MDTNSSMDTKTGIGTRTILCFGDSNTWGSIARPFPRELPSDRYGEDTRWPCVLRSALGPGYRVIEEGLSGRATCYQTPEEPHKNAQPYLLPCLLSHRPLDLVILMLGSNDVKSAFGLGPERMGDGMRALLDIVLGCEACGRDGKAPKVLVIAPVPIARPTGRQDYFAARGGERGIALMRRMEEDLEVLAAERGCAFLRASEVAAVDLNDGLHLDASSHRALGARVAEAVTDLMGA